MTAIRRMYIERDGTKKSSAVILSPENRADGCQLTHPDLIYVMSPEAAEELFQAARKIYSSGEGTNSYEYESARDYLATLEKEIGNG